ncbi:YbaB/EbfC family nucleoid-associated protein [Rhodococcus globerulus]|nr:YbaB/EbfC family nucleoid-associated protein [Rhodococcus globerulus]NMD61941.1 YbaB/EbfC family nucleoid-associated protein [Nocardia globerula]RZL25216.1 MAG: YbaB/EbfC family DNA-binding protein [Rhodococcus sp. (in: high G+C Gram-positive bacteria)]
MGAIVSTAQWNSARGRSEVLRGQIDSMMEDLHERTRLLALAQEKIALSTARALSADGLVEVVVNASGAVVGVKFSSDACAKSTPKKLGASVLAASTAASADMRRQNAEILKPFTTTTQLDLPDLITGAPSVRGLSAVPQIAEHMEQDWDQTVLRSAGNV